MANQPPDADFKVSIEVIHKGCLAVLISKYSPEGEAKKHTNEIYEDIFEEELFAWCTNKDQWPKSRTEELFCQWFNVEFHSEVMDLYEDSTEKEW